MMCGPCAGLARSRRRASTGPPFASPDMKAFISDEMCAHWEANRAELIWRSGKTEADVFLDALPWLYVGGSADSLPWACRHLD